MAHCHTKSGTQEVQRLLRHHIAQALKALQGNQPLSDTVVHRARKQLKKGRADLRLLRKALGSQTYAQENRALYLACCCCATCTPRTTALCRWIGDGEQLVRIQCVSAPQCEEFCGDRTRLAIANRLTVPLHDGSNLD
jgi:hypothetical protein